MFNKRLAVAIAAVSMSLGSIGHADFATLLDLIDGGSLTEGGYTYNNFSIGADIGTIAPDYTQIMVTTLPNGLEISGGGEFALNAGSDSLILQMIFNASNTAGIGQTGADLTFGAPVAGTNGVVDLFQEVGENLSSFNIASANATLDPAFGVINLSDQQNFSAQQSVGSRTSFSLFADDTVAVSADSFRVTLAIPEPSSALLLTLVGSALVARRRRK